MPEEQSVYKAVAAVAAEIGAVGKNAKMDAGPAKYHYRSLDDLINAVHPALTKHGVTFTPHDIQVLDIFERTTRSGSVQYHGRAMVRYRVYGPEGDFIEAVVLAEGADTGDKLTNKMMSGAYKYVLAQVLSIPYSGVEDQDATLSEPVMQMTVEELHGRLSDAADRLNKTTAEITTKYRKQNGDISLDAFYALPAEQIYGFVRQVVAAAAKVDA